MRLLCTGDLHLGAHPEYGRKPGDRLRDQAHVLEQIATLAFKENVDLILNAGDTFDGPSVPPEQLDIYARFVAACDAMQIPIVALTGNGRHDAAMRDVDGMQIFNRIPGITVCSTPTVIPFGGVTVACLPWVHPGRLVAAEGGGDRDEINRRAAELLVAVARGLRDQAPTDRPCVLMLHGSVSGASTPDGALTDLFREPVIDWHALEELGFDAVVMGHIHAPQHFLGDGIACRIIYHKAGTPTTTSTSFYVGSPMPLNFGEADCAHGVWILDLGGDGLGADFIPIESPPFVTAGLSIDEVHGSSIDCDDDDDVTDAIVRLRFTATNDQMRRIDLPAHRASLVEDGARIVKVEPTIIRADRARVEGVDETLAPLAALGMYVDSNEIPAEQADRMRARTARYLEASHG